MGECGLGHRLGPQGEEHGVTSLRVHHCLWVCLPAWLLGEGRPFVY